MVEKMRMGNIIVSACFVLIFLAALVYAEGVTDAETVGRLDATVCCEKTNAGLYCQNVPEEDCAADSFAIPTSCEATQPCNPGYCYDSIEGTCLDNVPQMVCNDNNGTWSEEQPASCDLGCCILGDQASFVTLVRCKRLSGFYGLDTNWNGGVQDEAQCILTARSEEKGACVFEKDFETTCKITTRAGCTEDEASEFAASDFGVETQVGDNDINGSGLLTSPGVEFFPGKLCSAEELGTNCGPTKQTTCVDGKEEVYFIDTCGNTANIYDANKANDRSYWNDMTDKKESCSPDGANEDSQVCGNCNYLLGSYCRATNDDTGQPRYGDNICQSLNCVDETGAKRLHGESWCGYDVENFDYTFKEAGNPGILQQATADAIRNVAAGTNANLGFLKAGDSPVGGRFYRYSCQNGEVVTEPCADFKQEECIENNIEGYSEAQCRVNRWQDCTAQYTTSDCENTDQRDCVWMAGIEYVLMGSIANGSALDKNSLSGAGDQLAAFNRGERELGACVPKVAPGLQFWGNEEAGGETEIVSVCSQANAICPVTYEKGIGGDWECVENCECLSPEMHVRRAGLCMALGDCGPKTNIIDVKGRGQGYRIFEEEKDGD